ncbi:MAG: hypothetical protein M5R38_17185 [Candidatus Methylomirabilis sp.]|nr:hypothetical protein [Candidatus Methylomirabilis sp.]
MVEVASPKVSVRLPQAPVPLTVKVTGWPTTTVEGIAESDVTAPGKLTTIVGPTAVAGVQKAAEPPAALAIILKLPAARYAWLTVVVVFDGTVVDVASPKLTVMSPALQPEELTVTETGCPTTTDTGDAVTDSAAQAGLDIASEANTISMRIVARRLILVPPFGVTVTYYFEPTFPSPLPTAGEG